MSENTVFTCNGTGKAEISVEHIEVKVTSSFMQLLLFFGVQRSIFRQFLADKEQDEKNESL